MKNKELDIGELPEKWYMKITGENLQPVNKWLGEKHGYNLGAWSCVYYNKCASDIGNQPKDYLEINFE